MLIIVLVGELTILLECVLAGVAAVPSARSTVKAAARCLKASVSGPPPATSNSRRRSTMEAYVLPEPDTPVRNKDYFSQIRQGEERNP